MSSSSIHDESLFLPARQGRNQTRGLTVVSMSSDDDSYLKSGVVDLSKTSLKVFRSFLKVTTNEAGCDVLDATGIISKECFQAWVTSRRCTLKHPEKAFQRTLSAHISGADGRQPFSPEEEASILSHLRKRQLWPCFQNAKVQFGSKGFRALGFHERTRKDKHKKAVQQGSSSSPSSAVDQSRKTTEQAGYLAPCTLGVQEARSPRATSSNQFMAIHNKRHRLSSSMEHAMHASHHELLCLERPDCSRDDVLYQLQCFEQQYECHSNGHSADFVVHPSGSSNYAHPATHILNYAEESELSLLFPEPHHLFAALEDSKEARSASNRFFLSSVSDDDDDTQQYSPECSLLQ